VPVEPRFDLCANSILPEFAFKFGERAQSLRDSCFRRECCDRIALQPSERIDPFRIVFAGEPCGAARIFEPLLSIA